MGYPESKLAQDIFDSYNDRNFTGAIVYGKKGMGKSSYALWTIFDLYHNGFGYSKKDAWDMALGKTLHNLDQIIESMSEYIDDPDNRSPVFHMDDAGAYFSGYAYHLYRNEHGLFQAMLDLMRTISSGLIYTCPGPQDLVGYISNEENKIIAIRDQYKTKDYEWTPDSKWERVALIFNKNTYPSGTTKIEGMETYFSKFICKLPDDIFEVYNKRRAEYFKPFFNKFKKLIEKRKKDGKTDISKDDLIKYLLEDEKDYWNLSPGQGQKKIKIPKSNGNIAEILRMNKKEIYSKRSH